MVQKSVIHILGMCERTGPEMKRFTQKKRVFSDNRGPVRIHTAIKQWNVIFVLLISWESTQGRAWANPNVLQAQTVISEQYSKTDQGHMETKWPPWSPYLNLSVTASAIQFITLKEHMNTVLSSSIISLPTFQPQAFHLPNHLHPCRTSSDKIGHKLSGLLAVPRDHSHEKNGL